MAADGRECAEGWGRQKEEGSKAWERQVVSECVQGGGTDWLYRPDGAREGHAYWAPLSFLLGGRRFQLRVCTLIPALGPSGINHSSLE